MRFFDKIEDVTIVDNRHVRISLSGDSLIAIAFCFPMCYFFA